MDRARQGLELVRRGLEVEPGDRGDRGGHFLVEADRRVEPGADRRAARASSIGRAVILMRLIEDDLRGIAGKFLAEGEGVASACGAKPILTIWSKALPWRQRGVWF